MHLGVRQAPRRGHLGLRWHRLHLGMPAWAQPCRLMVAAGVPLRYLVTQTVLRHLPLTATALRHLPRAATVLR